MVPLRSARGESAPHPALRATFSPPCGEKESVVIWFVEFGHATAVCGGGDLSMLSLSFLEWCVARICGCLRGAICVSLR